MMAKQRKKSACFLICIFLSIFANTLPALAQAALDKNAHQRDELFVLASNIEAPIQNSDPVPTVLYRVSIEGLITEAVVLRGSALRGAKNWLPEGVSSINEVGRYLIVVYPHDVPCCVIFIPEYHPADFKSVRVVTDGMTGLNCGLSSIRSDESEPCSLWELIPDASPVLLSEGKIPTTLHSVCKRHGQPAYTVTDRWDDYKAIRFDGVTPLSKQCLLSSLNGLIDEYVLGGPSIKITPMPTDFPPSKTRRGVFLDAANSRFRVVSIGGKDLIDPNADVFVQTVANGRWKRLPVFPVRSTGTHLWDIDRMTYRLFDDWLVTSVSAKLLAANQIIDTAVPEVLTVVPTGEQRTDWGIKVEPTAAPEVATLPARRITLWNLADGRRIDIEIPEDDSEVVHVFDDHQALLRIHDKLFFAEIAGSKLTGYKLVAFDSAIPQVHWAFYSSQ